MRRLTHSQNLTKTIFGMQETKLIGFAGRKRSGKTSLSKIMEKHYGAVTITVANYLKALCADLLSVTLDVLNKQKDDGTVFSVRPDDVWYDKLHKATGIAIPDIKSTIGEIEFTNVRQLLQVIGTDLIRKYVPDWHIAKMKTDILKEFEKGNLVTVDDLRFKDEVEAVRSLGGRCFFIVRPYDVDVSNHISEHSLAWYMFDKNDVIINDEPISMLEKNFISHYENGFKGGINSQLLLSEKPGYTENMNIKFGTEMNDVVKEIVNQNADLEMFKTRGIITYKPTSDEMNREFMHQVYNREPNENLKLHNYMIYNPIINENLKRYL